MSVVELIQSEEIKLAWAISISEETVKNQKSFSKVRNCLRFWKAREKGIHPKCDYIELPVSLMADFLLAYGHIWFRTNKVSIPCPQNKQNPILLSVTLILVVAGAAAAHTGGYNVPCFKSRKTMTTVLLYFYSPH